MGSVRTLLAISVVFAHTYGFLLVGGRLAVQLFYIISGFLISYILTEARTYKSTKAFYYNRFLRLFPMYWVVAALSLLSLFLLTVFFAVPHEFFSTYSDLNFGGRVLLYFSNIFIFAQDWVLFAGVRGGELQLVSDFNESEILVYQGLIVPQGWTLGIELSFYVIAPYILTNKRVLLLFLLFAFMVRGFLIYQGLGLQDPWTHRFFPAELALFLFGSLSHQVWGPYLHSKNMITARSSACVTLIILFYASIYFLLTNRTLHTLAIIGCFVLALPYLFAFQKSNKWDVWIGELSYPIYISHILVIWTFGYYLENVYAIKLNSILGALLIVLFTIGLSVFLNFYIGRAVNDMRTRVKIRQLMQ